MTSLSDRLRIVMERHGWSQREYSRRAGLEEIHVGQIIRRLARNPDARVSHDVLMSLANAGGVSVQWLLTGREAEARDATMTTPAERTVILGELPEWPELQRAAMELAADVPEWCFRRLAKEPAILTSKLTPALVAGLARLVQRYLRPSE